MRVPTVKSVELSPSNWELLNRIIARYLADGYELVSAVPIGGSEILYTWVRWSEQAVESNPAKKVA